jgi:hypothetical protein
MSMVYYAGCNGIEFSRTHLRNSKRTVLTYLTVRGGFPWRMDTSGVIGHVEALIKSLKMS